MVTVAERTTAVADGFEEKDFYLDEFRAHTLCFAVSLAECEEPGGLAMLGDVVRELIANDTRVIVLLGIARGERQAALQRVRRRLQPLVLSDQVLSRFPLVRGRRSLAPCVLDLIGLDDRGDDDRWLGDVWSVLRLQPLLVGLVEETKLLEVAQQLTTRLRVHKLVIMERDGGISTPHGGQLSFLDAEMLAAVLHVGGAEWAGLEGRRDTLRSVQASLHGGVHAVNLCRLDGLARELYTYEGSGTLFTLVDYCRIDRLGIDDFEQVERLLERGQREGFLKLRDPEETTRILMSGYGATIGARHLAGVCALETERYRDEQAGEIVGLYTITRFKGEGVGVRLIERVLKDAEAMQLRYAFACTVDQRAQIFFERRGFRRVPQSAVPRAKWIGYDQARRSVLSVFRRDLPAHAAPPPQ